MRTTHTEVDLTAYLKEPHKTIYALGVANGLRISDIVSLKKAALKVEKPTIHEQKTGKSKRLYIPVKVRKKLVEFANKSKNEYIFYSDSKSGHISRQAVFKAIKKASQKADIKGNIGTHTMRKNYAYKIYKRRNNLQMVQSRLNHERLQDSLLYLL